MPEVTNFNLDNLRASNDEIMERAREEGRKYYDDKAREQTRERLRSNAAATLESMQKNGFFETLGGFFGGFLNAATVTARAPQQTTEKTTQKNAVLPLIFVCVALLFITNKK